MSSKNCYTKLPLMETLSPRVTRVLGCNPSYKTMMGSNTYIVGTGSKRILVDTGEGIPGYLLALKQTLHQLDCTISQILVTHWHFDHVGGVKDILKEIQPGAEVSKLKCTGRDFDKDYSPGVEYNYVTDGTVFTCDGATLRAIHSPGHASDHMCLYLEEEEALFSADCILGETTTYIEDLGETMTSLKKLKTLQSKLIYPGHGPVITDPGAWIGFYIQHRGEREAAILNTLQTSGGGAMDVLDIVKTVYEGTDPKLFGIASAHVRLHLDKLLQENKIKHLQESVDSGWMINTA